MKRKIYSKLLEWKQQRNGATAVLIEGARRIGKSYIVEEFARNEYDSYIIIDFNKADKVVATWFDTLLEDLDTLLMNLQIHYNTRLTPGRSGTTISKQGHSLASRKTCETLSSPPRRKQCLCIRWISRSFFGQWATIC